MLNLKNIKTSLFISVAILASFSLSAAYSEDSKNLDGDYFVLVDGGTFKSYSSKENPDSYEPHNETVLDFYIAQELHKIKEYNP